MEKLFRFLDQIFNDTNVNWLGIVVGLGTVLSFGLLFFYAAVSIVSKIAGLFAA